MKISKEKFYQKLSKHLQIQVSDCTLFFDRIGMSGFDADEFVSWLQDEFGVDFSTFNYKEYYVADGDNFIRLIFDNFYKTKKMPTKNFSALHLYNVVKAGIWFPPASPIVN